MRRNHQSHLLGRLWEKIWFDSPPHDWATTKKGQKVWDLASIGDVLTSCKRAPRESNRGTWLEVSRLHRIRHRRRAWDSDPTMLYYCFFNKQTRELSCRLLRPRLLVRVNNRWNNFIVSSRLWRPKKQGSTGQARTSSKDVLHTFSLCVSFSHRNKFVLLPRAHKSDVGLPLNTLWML